MKIKELRQKPKEELQQLLKDLRGRLEDLRFQHHGGKLSNFRELRFIRRDIARALTLLKSR